MIVRPGLVYPSGKPAKRTDYDCDMGSLLTRESMKLLKSIGLSALSPFSIEKKSALFFKKPFTNAKIRVIIYI